MSICLALGLIAVSAAPLRAEPFCPEANVKLVIPFPAGGPVDAVARIFSEPLKAALEQTVLLEHKAGASGSVATGFVATAPGNGCTVLFSYDTHGVNPAVFDKLPFDTLTAFKAVSLVATVPNVLVAHPTQPWKTLDDVVAEARKQDGALVYATGGTATLAHLTMKRIEQIKDVRLRHVPYRGGAPALQDVLGGHVPLMLGSLLSVGGAVKDGRLRALVQTGAQRHPDLPDVPTLADVGIPNFTAVSWVGAFLPASAPDTLVSRLNTAIKAAAADVSVKQRMAALGFQVVGSAPDELQTFVAAEIVRWTEIVRQHNIKAD